MYTTPSPHKPLDSKPTWPHHRKSHTTQRIAKQNTSVFKAKIIKNHHITTIPILVLLIVQLIRIFYFSNILFCMFCTQVALCKKGGRVSSENHPDFGIERRPNPTAQLLGEGQLFQQTQQHTRGPSWNHSADHPNVTRALRCHGNTFVAKYEHNKKP